MTYFIYLICLFPFAYLVRFSVGGIPTTLLEILIYVSVIFTLFIKIYKKDKIIFPDIKILFPVLLFVLAGVFSVFISPDKTQALGLFKAYIIDPILFFLVIYTNIKDEKQFDLVIKSLILSGFIVSIHAIIQKSMNIGIDEGRVVGIFGYSPNYLALYLSPLAALTWINFNNYYPTNKKYFWIYLLIFLIMLMAILLSGSRAGIGSLVLGVFIFYFIKYYRFIKSNKSILFVLIFVFVAGLYFTWQNMKPDFRQNPESLRAATSNNIRWEIWKTTIYDIIPKNSNWLKGVGLGNFQNYFTDLTKGRINYPEWVSPWALTPHNIFINIWINLGALGLIAFIWILAIYFQKSKENIKYMSMFAVVMFVILAQGIVDSAYWKNDLALIFWILFGLSLLDINTNHSRSIN